MSITETLEKPATAAVANPYLRGNFAPVEVETTAFDLAVSGQIPKDLTGRLVRIGPNPIDADPANYHWFTGTGMAHGVRLEGGKAKWYRNRYILGDDAVAAHLGRAPIGGPRNGFGSDANTNIIAMGAKTYAVVEAGALPVELTDELESVARSNLGGTLAHGFAAHPKVDGPTGELHAITYEPMREALHYLVVDTAGRSRTVAEISAPHFPMIHDTAITQRFAIVLDLPVDFSLSLVGKGFPFAWNPDRMPRIGLVPRDGDLAGLKWIEAPSCFVFHVMNAYDEAVSGDVIMDVVRHPRMFATEMRGPSEGEPILVRWRIDLASGKLSETVLDERGLEFPRFNDAHGALAYRYGYSAGAFDKLKGFGPAYKHDVTRGRNETHDYGPGRATLEPVFVERAGAREEDDGYVISYVYDAGRNASDVVILSAQDFEGPPLATITLPTRVPFGFHGNWIPDPA
jgi:carotenoid cleavage dioxygenase